MMFRRPSDFAAAIRPSMPPQAVTDVAVFAVDSLHDAEPLLFELPHAATTKTATTARARWRQRLPNFMLRLPLQERPVTGQNQPVAGQSWRHAADVARMELRRVVDFS